MSDHRTAARPCHDRTMRQKTGTSSLSVIPSLANYSTKNSEEREAFLRETRTFASNCPATHSREIRRDSLPTACEWLDSKCHTRPRNRCTYVRVILLSLSLSLSLFSNASQSSTTFDQNGQNDQLIIFVRYFVDVKQCIFGKNANDSL